MSNFSSNMHIPLFTSSRQIEQGGEEVMDFSGLFAAESDEQVLSKPTKQSYPLTSYYTNEAINAASIAQQYACIGSSMGTHNLNYTSLSINADPSTSKEMNAYQSSTINRMQQMSNEQLTSIAQGLVNGNNFTSNVNSGNVQLPPIENSLQSLLQSSLHHPSLFPEVRNHVQQEYNVHSVPVKKQRINPMLPPNNMQCPTLSVPNQFQQMRNNANPTHQATTNIQINHQVHSVPNSLNFTKPLFTSHHHHQRPGGIASSLGDFPDPNDLYNALFQQKAQFQDQFMQQSVQQHHQHQQSVAVSGTQQHQPVAAQNQRSSLSSRDLITSPNIEVLISETKEATNTAISKKKERNRFHAKQCRVRKKFFLESLQSEVKALQNENMSLRMLIKEKIPKEADDILSECVSPTLSFANVLSNDNNQNEPLELHPFDLNFMNALRVGQRSIIITNPMLPDNPITFASAGFYDLTGYSKDEVIGKNCRFLQGSGTSPQAIKIIKQALELEKDVDVCLLNYKKDGTPFWNQVFIGALRDINNNVVNYIGNISEVKRVDVNATIEEMVNIVMPLPKGAEAETEADSEEDKS